MDWRDDEIGFDDYSDIPLPLPQSDSYHVRSSPISGRGVLATKRLDHGTVLLQDRGVCTNVGNFASDKPTSIASTSGIIHGSFVGQQSPIAYTILREYRKEVCGGCFGYDRGREWKTRFEPVQSLSPKKDLDNVNVTGIVFCSESCRDNWTATYGTTGMIAFAALEEAVRRASKQNSRASKNAIPEQHRHQYDDTDVLDNLENSEQTINGTTKESKTRGMTLDTKPTEQPDTSPSLESIRSTWHAAAIQARVIAASRTKAHPSKTEKRMLRAASEPTSVDSDLCYYLLTGVLNAYNAANRLLVESTEDGSKTDTSGTEPPAANTHDEAKQNHVYSDQANSETQQENAPKSITTRTLVQVRSLLPSLLTLAPDPTCYAHPSSTLHLYKTSYLLLHTLLPLNLLPYLTPELTHELNSRASHNAFSIRPFEQSDGDQSGEFMGWGVWPAASFFNHSCAPNVGKRRKARAWEFYIDKQVGGGTDGSIDGKSVLAGEELCITYLGGDEKDLNVAERRKRLREGWGFECMCKRCINEDVRNHGHA